MIVAINYANDLYKKTQKYCTHSAYKYGVDRRSSIYGYDVYIT